MLETNRNVVETEPPATVAVRHLALVDDEEGIRRMLAEYLGAHGFRVSVASSCAGLRQIVDSEPVDLVVLDLGLPGEDGLVALRELRVRSTVGIVVLTARSDTIDRIVGIEM